MRTPLFLRTTLKAGSVVLLWLLSASISEPVAPAVHTVTNSPAAKVPTLKQLVRQVRSVGAPLKHRRRYGIRFHLARTWFEREASRAAVDDDQAIQTDTAAAPFVVDAEIELRPLGAFIDSPKALPATAAFSPRSPRGPPRTV